MAQLSDRTRQRIAEAYRKGPGAFLPQPRRLLADGNDSRVETDHRLRQAVKELRIPCRIIAEKAGVTMYQAGKQVRTAAFSPPVRAAIEELIGCHSVVATSTPTGGQAGWWPGKRSYR